MIGGAFRVLPLLCARAVRDGGRHQLAATSPTTRAVPLPEPGPTPSPNEASTPTPGPLTTNTSNATSTTPAPTVAQIPMEPCEIGAGGDTPGNSTFVRGRGLKPGLGQRYWVTARNAAVR